MTDTPIPPVDLKALAFLTELLEATGADYVTEQQWRAYCDRPALVQNDKYETAIGPDGEPLKDAHGRIQKRPVDGRARGFTIPTMLERGMIVEAKACFHAPRNGHNQPPLAIYRPA